MAWIAEGVRELTDMSVVLIGPTSRNGAPGVLSHQLACCLTCMHTHTHTRTRARAQTHTHGRNDPPYSQGYNMSRVSLSKSVAADVELQSEMEASPNAFG